MDKEERLAQLVKESKFLFLKEGREKLNQVMITLLNYRLHRRKDDVYELERFFHSLKGTGSTLQFEKLTSIGEKYEDYLNGVKESEELPEGFFLKILDGLALVHEGLEELALKHNGEGENDPDSDSGADNGGFVESGLTDESEAKKTILLVDDMSVIVHLIEAHLNSINYDVITAKDGQEGIRKCKALRPDLMLVDLMLPKVDGFEVCRRIKNDLETKDTKIIVVTSKNKKEDVVKCFQAGADDYMVKPFKMSELEQRVKHLLGD